MLKCFLLCIATCVQCVNACLAGLALSGHSQPSLFVPLFVLRQPAVSFAAVGEHDRATASRHSQCNREPNSECGEAGNQGRQPHHLTHLVPQVFHMCALRLQHSFSSLSAADHVAPPPVGGVVSPVHSGDG